MNKWYVSALNYAEQHVWAKKTWPKIVDLNDFDLLLAAFQSVISRTFIKCMNDLQWCLLTCLVENWQIQAGWWLVSITLWIDNSLVVRDVNMMLGKKVLISFGFLKNVKVWGKDVKHIKTNSIVDLLAEKLKTEPEVILVLCVCGCAFFFIFKWFFVTNNQLIKHGLKLSVWSVWLYLNCKVVAQVTSWLILEAFCFFSFIEFGNMV